MEDEKSLTFLESWSRLTPEGKKEVLRQMKDASSGVLTWDRMTLEERREIALFVGETMPSIVIKDRFIQETVVSLLDEAIRNLRHYLEEATDAAISWESPFVELQIPMEPEVPPMSAPMDEDLLSMETVTKAAARRLIEVTRRLVIEKLTNGAVIVRRDGTEFPVVPPELAEEMKTWPKRKRQKFEDSYGEPFVFGGTYFEEGRDFEADVPEDEPARLTRSGRKRLRNLAPFLEINGDHDGTPFSGSLIVAFHPLLVDEDEGRSYFPVVVGIQINEWNEDGTPARTTPAEWTQEDRKGLWTGILSAVDRLRAEVLQDTESPQPQPQPQEPDTTSTKAETSVTSTVDTMEALSRFTPSAPVPMGPPSDSRKARYLLNTETRHSRRASYVFRTSGGFTFPKKWSAVPKWTDLVEKEKTFWTDTLGQDAFLETDERPALLERRTVQMGRDPETGKRLTRTEVFLSKEAERELEDRAGLRGFIRVERDPGKRLQENLVRVVKAGPARFTTRVSWYREALFLAGDGLDIRERELLIAKERQKQGDLFEDHTPRQKAVLDGLLENLEMIRYGKVLMEALSARFGAEGRNPVRVPAHDIKVLFGWENDPRGMERIRGSLYSLTEFRFGCEIEGSTRPMEMYGNFVASYRYEGRGPGDHSDGDFEVWINPDFLGALTVFRIWTSKEKYARELYQWTKALDKDEEKVLSKEPFLRGFSTLSPYFHKAKGFTDTQKNLCRWIESQVTRKSDPIPKRRKHLKVKRSASDAQEPRLYGHDFCPLIPEGTLLAGALGSFGPNAESGRTLGGTARRPTKTGGGHAEGLLAVLGYDYPPGAAFQRRREIVRDALQDIVLVVREAFRGVVAAQTPDGWMTLEDASDSLTEEELVKVRWFLFVTPDPTGHIGREVEKYQRERWEKGETPHLIKVTRDRKLVEASRSRETPEALEKLEGASGEPKVGLEWSPLWQQFRAAIPRRGLTQTKAAGLFGVSQPTLAGWIAGPEKGYSIPEELIPLVKRWVDGGEPPTVEELASRRTKRPGVNPDTGKPWTGPRKGPEAPPEEEPE